MPIVKEPRMNEFAAEEVLKVLAIETAPALQQMARDDNWNDGFAVPLAIANHPRCDLATALELFWRAGAIEVHLGEQSTRSSADWVEFCHLLTARLLEGHYTLGAASFSPALTATQRHKLRARNVPDLFLSRVRGKDSA